MAVLRSGIQDGHTVHVQAVQKGRGGIQSNHTGLMKIRTGNAI